MKYVLLVLLSFFSGVLAEKHFNILDRASTKVVAEEFKCPCKCCCDCCKACPGKGGTEQCVCDECPCCEKCPGK